MKWKNSTRIPKNQSTGRPLAWLVLMPVVLLLCGCPPSPPPPPPAAPLLVAGVTNARLIPATASDPALVIIMSNPWQKTNPKFASTFTWGWLEDALVGNPFSFQLQINANFVNGFSVLDAAGTALVKVNNLSNTSHLCSDSTGHTMPSSQCFWSPGNSPYITPPPVPKASPVYSITFENTCGGAIAPPRTAFTVGDRTAHCVPGQASGAAALLTISPVRPITPSVKVRFNLVATNAAGSASTPFDVMLVYPPPPAYIPWTQSSSPSAPNMPPGAPGCPGEQQSFSFQMTCTRGGSAQTVPLAGTGCSRAEAFAQLQSIYAIELMQGCVLGP